MYIEPVINSENELEGIPDEKDTGTNIPVKKGKVDSLTVYEVTDYELDTIENGNPESIYLNIAVSLISTFLSFIAVLSTTEIKSIKLYLLFIVITVISALGGIILLVLWYRGRKSVKSVIEKIRSRCPQ